MTYRSRLHILQHTLAKSGCDALLFDDPTNLFYLTGLDLSIGKLLVHAKGADLFVDGRYIESCRHSSPFPVRLSDPPSLETILKTNEFSHIKKLAFDSDKTTFKNYELFQNKLSESCSGQINYIPLDAPLKLQRSIKDAKEIQSLKEAGALGSQGFDFLCNLLKENISEQECAIELEIFWKRQGSKGVAFDPIIAFGANSSMPHYRAGNDRLKKGDVALLDIGVNYKHYHSDMTRIVFFGEPNTRLLAIHSIVQKAQLAALALCKPGSTLGQLDRAAREIIADHGYGEQFTHSLGHGVGLDIHEYPTIKNIPPLDKVPLMKGMVITIEPGIYVPGLGGIRIEDTVAITDDGHENLTLRSTDPVFI